MEVIRGHAEDLRWRASQKRGRGSRRTSKLIAGSHWPTQLAQLGRPGESTGRIHHTVHELEGHGKGADRKSVV